MHNGGVFVTTDKTQPFEVFHIQSEKDSLKGMADRFEAVKTVRRKYEEQNSTVQPEKAGSQN
jgi:hypothetical protein